MGKIIKFPNKKIYDQTKPETEIELKNSKENYRMSYIDDVSEFITNIVIVETSRAGFDLSDEDVEDILLISECVKSLMMKKNGMYHALQDLSLELEDGGLTKDIKSDTILENEGCE